MIRWRKPFITVRLDQSPYRRSRAPYITRRQELSLSSSLLASGDDLAVNVATVGLIEGLKADGDTRIREFLGPVSLEEYDALVY